MTKAKANLKATVVAKVIRADGTVEDLGRISDVSDTDANTVVKLLRKLKGEK